MEPIRHRLRVAAAPARAFEVFTVGMGSWWDPAYSPDPSTFTGIAVEPAVAGSVALQHGATSYPFGEVTVWEPGRRYAQTFTLAMDPDHPSTLEVLFTPVEDGTDVLVEHGGWSAANAGFREKYGDWPRLLGRYVAAVEQPGRH